MTVWTALKALPRLACHIALQTTYTLRRSDCPMLALQCWQACHLHSMKDLSGMGLCCHSHAVRRVARCSSAHMDHLCRSGLDAA